MNVLFVGVGSIGTRHLKNLRNLCLEKNIPLVVSALRSNMRPLPQDTQTLIDRQFPSLDDTVYDLAFITNPTNLHKNALADLKGRARFFFIEKPIFEDCSHSLESLGLTEQNAYVAAPMRYCGAYRKLKELLQNTPAFSVRIICSSYLPGWRPDADYRKVYSAIKALGGGVTIDLIHELDYMVDLFGFPEQSFNFKGQYSNLEIDSDDLSVYIARYKDKLCEVHLDYFGRTYRRTCEVFTASGTITADFGSGIITLADGSCIDCSEEVNMRFVREMANLFEIIDEKAENINSPEKALRVLGLTLGEEI